MTAEQAVTAWLRQQGHRDPEAATLDLFHILKGHGWRHIPPPATPPRGTPAPAERHRDELDEARQRLAEINAARRAEDTP